MRIILAHGILGPLDELIYLSPAIIFMVTAGLGWLRLRRAHDTSQSPPDDHSTESE